MGPLLSRTAIIVLAAGASTRMGAPKQLLPWRGKTLLRDVIENLLASRVHEVVVVLGCRAEEVRRSLLPTFRAAPSLARAATLRTLVNANWEAGMLSSVQCGLRAVKGDPEAVAVALGDQPGVPPQAVDELFLAQRKIPGSIVMPKCGERRGHPVVFDARYNADILALAERQTLRDVMDVHRERVAFVEVDSLQWFDDLDTPDDYERRLNA